uniref:Uncharacterized protein n=1 Tax=Arundo donax TaxID=35708 RepID=A0A0A9E439_ARUDO
MVCPSCKEKEAIGENTADKCYSRKCKQIQKNICHKYAMDHEKCKKARESCGCDDSSKNFVLLIQVELYVLVPITSSLSAILPNMLQFPPSCLDYFKTSILSSTCVCYIKPIMNGLGL